MTFPLRHSLLCLDIWKCHIYIAKSSSLTVRSNVNKLFACLLRSRESGPTAGIQSLFQQWRKLSPSDLNNRRDHVGPCCMVAVASEGAALITLGCSQSSSSCQKPRLLLRPNNTSSLRRLAPSTSPFLFFFIFCRNFVKKLMLFGLPKITACAQPSLTHQWLLNRTRRWRLAGAASFVHQTSPRLVESQGRNSIVVVGLISQATLLARLSVRYFISSTSRRRPPPPPSPPPAAKTNWFSAQPVMRSEELVLNESGFTADPPSHLSTPAGGPSDFTQVALCWSSTCCYLHPWILRTHTHAHTRRKTHFTCPFFHSC